MPRDVYMVQVNWAGAVYVKELNFFRSQKGFSQVWGKAWKPIVATSIEDARKRACKKFKLARPYEQQAK